MADNSKCVVLVPVAKTMELETEQALSRLSEQGYIVRTLRGGSAVDLVRSIMASHAFRDGFEETIWIDSDVVFDPEDVDKLRSHGLPMSAGLYPKKDRQEFACKFLEGTGKLTFGVGGSLTEVELLGMGFTYVRREVYDGILKTCELPSCDGAYDEKSGVWPLFQPLVITGANGKPQYLSEDFSFCHRAKLAGFKCIADTTIRLGHVHRHVKTWDDFVPRQTFSSIDVGFERT